MVARNWLIGWYIVEYEQIGADRAKYGSRLIERLAIAMPEGVISHELAKIPPVLPRVSDSTGTVC